MIRSLADTPVDRLAQFVSSLDFATLPHDVVAKAKIHISDTLAVTIAGSRSNEFDILAKLRSNGSARLWGTGLTASVRDAALLNGCAAHAFELDDSGGCDHSGAVVMPALFSALHEVAKPVDGKTMIAAVVAGYDVGRRVLEATGGYEAHNGVGWHSTGTCGTLAAAAACARLFGLDASATRDAITIATSFSSGLWAFIHDGSQTKKLHAGRAAEGGFLAAMLARDGFAGPSKVFEDVWGGFFNAYNKSACHPELLSDGLGSVWKIERAVLKPYASCRGAHSAIDALEDILSDSTRDADEIVGMSLRMSPMLQDMCGAKVSDPMAAAQMSLPYALAARCVAGTAGLQAYTVASRTRADVRALMESIDVKGDGEMEAMSEPFLTVTFHDGLQITRTVPRATGSAERPMMTSAVEAKFVELASMGLTVPAASALWHSLSNFEQVADCIEIEGALAGQADRLPLFR